MSENISETIGILLQATGISTSLQKNAQQKHLQNGCLHPCSSFSTKYPAWVIRKTVLVLIKTYQYIVSPLIGPACRFYPSCSEYAYQAISRYGVLKGTMLSVKRLLKCHPFHPGGIDPVPWNLHLHCLFYHQPNMPFNKAALTFLFFRRK